MASVSSDQSQLTVQDEWTSEEHQGVVTTRRLLHQQVYVGACVLVLLAFLYAIRDVIPLFVIAFLLAYVLGPIVHRVAGPKNKGMSRGTAALAVYLVLITILGFGLYELYAATSDDIKNLLSNPNSVLSSRVASAISDGPLKRLPAAITQPLVQAVQNSDSLLLGFAKQVLPSLAHIVPKLLESIAIPIVAYYLLAEYERFIDILSPKRNIESRKRFDTLLQELNQSLQGYLKGQLTLSLIAGIAATLVLWVNGVRPALAVGLCAVILELVPVIGPLVWAFAAIILTYVQQPGHTIVVAILVLIIHQTDTHILAPRILGKHLRLHPVVVIFALLAGNSLLGLLGVLLAAPLAAALYIGGHYVLKDGLLSMRSILARPSTIVSDNLD